jgi:creatinine amidohydrolase
VANILGNALVAPTLTVGVSSEHMSFPGSMTIRQETFSAILIDYVVSLERSGFRWIVCLPSHGGNVEPLRVALPSIEAAIRKSRLIGFTDLYGLIAVGASVAERFNISSAIAGAHAGEWETSMILALKPDLVASDQLEAGYLGELEPVFDRIMSEGMESVTTNGILGDARPATAEHGRVYLDALSDFYAKWIRSAQEREGKGA